jgi:glycosyltransferase involved in cell wall biosynthesis
MIVHLTRALQAAGAEVTLYLPDPGQGWIAGQFAPGEVAIEHFHLDRPFSRKFAAWLTESLRGRRIAVAHSHDFSMAFYGAWAAGRAGVRHVITMHGGDYYAQRLRRRLALRWAIGRSQATVAVSPTLRDALCRNLWLPPGAVAVVPNGIPSTAAAPADLVGELDLPRGARILLAVGNLYAVKGHRHAITALQRLSQRHPEAYLVIAGRGELEGELRSQAAALGLADRVRLLGLRSDIPALLAAADVFLLPSLSEGLPIALLEAMFAGKPIVASDVGGIGAALGDGAAGILVPPGSDEALTAALDRLLSDPGAARGLGREAARRAEADFRLETMVSRYVALYR